MIYFLPAAVLLIIGWLIKYKKVTWLISGYNTASKKQKQKYDIERLCKYMGNFLFILASIFLIMSISSIIFARYINEITMIGFGVTGIVSICGIVYLNSENRVKKG